VYFKYFCCICNLNCILNTFWHVFEFCTFKIVSQNIPQKINLARSLMVTGVILPGDGIIAGYFSVQALPAEYP